MAAADKMQAENDNRASAKCPICAKASVKAYKPFCSKRCADVDLHRWLGGHYAIPAVDQELDSEIPEDGEG